MNELKLGGSEYFFIGLLAEFSVYGSSIRVTPGNVEWKENCLNI
jgi:hypothetical protein